MEDKFQKLKRVVSTIAKIARKPIIIAIGAIAITLVLMVSLLYLVDLLDGIYNEEDEKNVPYNIEQYMENIDISLDGDISTEKSAKELWDELIEKDVRIKEYLNDPYELKKLMNAQMATDLLDTRQDVTEEINWSKINKDIDSTEVQGIIKLKRAYENGTSEYITYVDPETFQSYIDDYNDNPTEANKKKALKYFTLEKGYVGAGLITAGTVINIPAGLGSVHTYMGWQCITDRSSTQYKLREQAGMNFDEEGFGKINGRYVIACTTTFGQVGDYIDFYQDDGTVIQCIIGDIKNQNDTGCNEWGHNNGHCIVEFVVDKSTWYNCGHPNPGQEGFHMEWNQNLTKAINGGSYFDNPNLGTSGASGVSDASNPLKWPTDGTDITSYFGKRTAPTAGASTNHGGIDIGVSTGTNVYATEAGIVTGAGYSDSGGNMVTIDHGNGYVTKYMHNSSIQVSVGDVVAKGQVIALSGSTGISTGPHLHFQIEYNGERIDPLTFKYDNGMGDGVGGFGSNYRRYINQCYNLCKSSNLA